jgi:hypothetical protein
MDAAWVIENTFVQLKLRGYPVHTENENRLINTMFTSTFRKVAAELTDILTRRPVSARIVSMDASDAMSIGKARGHAWKDELTSCKRRGVKRRMSGSPASTIEALESFVRTNDDVKVVGQSRNRLMSTLELWEYDLRMCVDAKAAISFSGNKSG